MPFITFEGGEGSGKSTQIKLLAAYLREKGKAVVVTREPGGTDGAEAIRGLLRGSIEWLPLSELLLQFAARNEHVKQLIKPALERGDFVLSDRFTDSTYAYQGYGMGMPLDAIAGLEKLVLGSFRPDKTFLLDIEPEVGLRRAISRDGNAERYEAMPMDFHRRLRSGYLEMAVADPNRSTVIDADAPSETIYRKIVEIMTDCFAL
jgi:dTMP kinase